MHPSIEHPRSVIPCLSFAMPHLDPRFTFSISATETSGQWSLVSRDEHVARMLLMSSCARHTS
jgi:hypothetical protein